MWEGCRAGAGMLQWVRRCLVPKSKVATRLFFNHPSPPLTLFAGAKQGGAGGDQGAEALGAIEGVGSRRAGRVGRGSLVAVSHVEQQKQSRDSSGV